MISQFDIKNFRCFKKLNQRGLKRFNFIVGESGTGKTALLEALFLGAAGNPEIWFRLRRWRGLGEGPMQINVRENYEALFRDLFFGFDQATGANIKMWDSSSGKRELEIYYERSAAYTLPLNDQEKEASAFAIDPIHFKWDSEGEVSHSKVEIRNGALYMAGSAKVYPLFLISPRTFSGRDNAQFYSNLSRRRRAGPVLDAIRSIFTDVEDLALELVAGEPQLHVSIPSLDEKLPLGDLSGGLSKYVEIVLAILTNPNGAILIDEIENGFYYKNMSGLLRNIVSLCDIHNVQLFATTHSYEFLQVMSEAISASKKGSEDFALLRLEKSGGKPAAITNIAGESYEAAMKESFEVR